MKYAALKLYIHHPQDVANQIFELLSLFIHDINGLLPGFEPGSSWWEADNMLMCRRATVD